MRPEVTDRFYRVFMYQPVDRVPDTEFGYWPQTIRRWLGEGMKIDLTRQEQNQMFLPRLDAFLGLEAEGCGVGVRTGMNPSFEHKVLEDKGASQIVQGGDGIIAERYGNDADESSIPRFIKFPIETPDDWKAMKERYRLDDPARKIPQENIDNARKGVAKGQMISIFFVGFYGQMRNFMGTENLSYAFYEQPAMVHDMVEHWAELLAGQIEQLPADLPIDTMSWWEDMAGRNGPLVGPKMFREFIQPGYRRVMSAAKKHGCELGIVDCDGNPHHIVGNWLEEGVNIMFPIEVGAGADPYLWRKEFGKTLRLRGGIAKEPLVRGKAAIDKELDRIRPLLEQGGYIPHLDHLVPPDISYANYCYYLERKRKLIGKA